MREIDLDFRRVLNAAVHGIVITDLAGKINFINDQAKEDLCLEGSKEIGESISDILPSGGRSVLRCLKKRKPLIGMRIRGENMALVLDLTYPKKDDLVLGGLCHLQKLQQAEPTLHKLQSYEFLNKQLTTIFESSSDGLLVCDDKGCVLKMNEASEKLNGLRSRDVIGKNVSEFVEKGVFDRSVTMEVLETNRQVSMLQFVENTRKYLLVTGTPAFDDEGNLSLVVVNERDITQLNVMRERLEETRMMNERYLDELTELNMKQLRDNEILAESEKTKLLLKVALKLARLEATNILITGESGTGKGVLAKFIHSNSKGKRKPFIQINCAAIPEGLLEAELFGYERGAFTGAREQGKIGLFELAESGTLFLDEIGDLPLSIQAKLLKYLDDHRITRLGGIKSVNVNCTMITATNQDLHTLTQKGAFRKDLFYRLNAFPLEVPPLRQRPEDIFALSNHFLSKYNRIYGFKRRVCRIGFDALLSYKFPGNVRELKNIIKKAVVMSEKDVLDDFIVRDLDIGASRRMAAPFGADRKLSLSDDLLAAEKVILTHAVSRCKSTRELANYLSVSQPTIVRKLRKHNLQVAPIQQ
jgi:PAS domain S-box-containing protein